MDWSRDKVVTICIHRDHTNLHSRLSSLTVKECPRRTVVKEEEEIRLQCCRCRRFSDKIVTVLFSHSAIVCKTACQAESCVPDRGLNIVIDV